MVSSKRNTSCSGARNASHIFSWLFHGETPGTKPDYLTRLLRRFYKQYIFYCVKLATQLFPCARSATFSLWMMLFKFESTSQCLMPLQKRIYIYLFYNQILLFNQTTFNSASISHNRHFYLGNMSHQRSGVRNIIEYKLADNRSKNYEVI